jgi:hypothetical protein
MIADGLAAAGLIRYRALASNAPSLASPGPWVSPGTAAT